MVSRSKTASTKPLSIILVPRVARGNFNTFLELELNEKLLHSTQRPLRMALSLSSGLLWLSRQQSSTDTRVSNKADERVAEVLQLACAVARDFVLFTIIIVWIQNARS